MLIMPKAEYITWQGHRFEGAGIKPDVEVPWSPEAFEGVFGRRRSGGLGCWSWVARDYSMLTPGSDSADCDGPLRSRRPPHPRPDGVTAGLTAGLFVSRLVRNEPYAHTHRA